MAAVLEAGYSAAKQVLNGKNAVRVENFSMDRAVLLPDKSDVALEWVLEREPDRLDALLLKGVVLCQLSEFSKAETLYHRLVRRHPDALLNLAFLYRDFMDAPDKALVYFQRYLDYSGENAEEKAFIDQEILVPNLIESLKKETL